MSLMSSPVVDVLIFPPLGGRKLTATKAWEGTGRFLIFLSFTVKTVKNESDYSILGVM